MLSTVSGSSSPACRAHRAPAYSLLHCHVMASTISGAATGDAPWQTHTVFNQVPPLEGVDVFASNTPLVEAVQREGAGWVSERASALGRFVGGRRAAAGVGATGEREQADPAHVRPLRAPHRRGRVPPRVAPADADGRGERAALAAVDERRALRAHGARGAVHDRDAGRGGLCVPDHDDLRGRSRAARAAGAGGRVGAAGDGHHL